MTAERLVELVASVKETHKAHAAMQKWAGGCDACDLLTALEAAQAAYGQLAPVAMELREQRDALQQRVETLEKVLQEHMEMNAYFMAQIERYGLTKNILTDEVLGKYRGFGVRAQAALRGEEATR